jgi:hypothetical protein
MFSTVEQLRAYIIENYPEVTSHKMDDSHWDLQCTHCKITRGFQVICRYLNFDPDPVYGARQVFDAPETYLFRCPVCGAFKLWSVFTVYVREAVGTTKHYYRLSSLPGEGLEDIDELPEEPPALRIAYRQAIRAMDGNAHLAAAAMFRRALQVITRQVLGAKPGNLGNELREVVGKIHNGVKISNDFAEIGYIIKEAGNQGAHPDADPDLLEFTQQDAEDLQNIFMELVSELFVVPAASQKKKAEFLARKKITPR